MDGKDDIRKEAPQRPDAERQPPRDLPAAQRDAEDDTTDGQMRYRDWASI